MAAPFKSVDKGFTLVELLLVIALLGITVGVTSDILLSIVRTYNKTQVTNEIEQQSNFVFLKLENEIRNAHAASTSDGSDLILEFDDNATVTYRYIFDPDDYFGVIYRTLDKEGDDFDDQMLPITVFEMVGGVDVTCSSPPNCFSITGTNPQVVSFAFKFEQATDSGKSYEGFTEIKNTIVLRNTY